MDDLSKSILSETSIRIRRIEADSVDSILKEETRETGDY